ncbi:MAG TPA: cupin domain-containing protein [Chloroflexota bacterium]
MPLEVFDARTDIRNLFITPEIRARIMRFDAGQVSEGHTHDLGHEMFLVLEGQAEFTIAGESAILGPGQLCVARAGEWHEIRTLPDAPMTLYLSVTPHLEPTHTQWDREGGSRLPYRYGLNTQEKAAESVEVLLERHLAASDELAEAAHEYAASQRRLAGGMELEEMTGSLQALYARFQDVERAWNELAPAAARLRDPA